jgi:hypothetical protein
VCVGKLCGGVAIEEAVAEDPAAAVEGDMRTWSWAVRRAWTNGESSSHVAPGGDDPGGDPVGDPSDPEAELAGGSASPSMLDAPALCTPSYVPEKSPEVELAGLAIK